MNLINGRPDLRQTSGFELKHFDRIGNIGVPRDVRPIMAVPRELLGVNHRTIAPPAESDAFLVDRYVLARDAEAFAALMSRHGPAVYAVCRARLRCDADADDAYQVVWFVFARDVETIRSPDRLAAWLVRIAALTCLKMHRTNARRRTVALPEELATKSDGGDPVRREATAMLAEELAALPEKMRAAVVLCALEDRSNGEAAAILGIPKGTVDSRLAAGKESLRVRLTRRGVALTTTFTLDALFAGLIADAYAPKLGPLSTAALDNAIRYSTGTAPLSAAGLLADGVTTTMMTTTRLLAAGLLAAGLMTTVGIGLYQAGAQEQPKPQAKANTPKDDKPKEAKEKPKADKPPEAKSDAKLPVADETTLRLVLKEQFTYDVHAITFEQLLDILRANHGLNSRMDIAAYKRREFFSNEEPISQIMQKFYETKISLKQSKSLTVTEVLTDALAQLPGKHSFRVAGNRILIGPAYIPPTIPNRVSDGEPLSISPEQLKEQILGEPISLSAEKQSLASILDELRKQTGANIVLDARSLQEVKQSNITLTIDDVRLLNALELIADMVNLKPVAMGNVYYITSPENAERLQQKVNEELFGKPNLPGPPRPAQGQG